MRTFRRLPFQSPGTETKPVYAALWHTLFLIAFFIFLKSSILEVWGYTGYDFELFYEAADNLWRGRSPYIEILAKYEADPTMASEVGPWCHYIYPTNFACLIMPLLVFPMFWAKKVYVFLMMAGYLIILWRLARLCLPKTSGPWWGLLFLATGLLWGPALETFRLGQSNAPVFLLLFGAWISARKGEELLAGALLGLACTIKLTPVVMIPLFVVAFRPKVAVAALVSFLGSFLILYPQHNWVYFTQIAPGMSNISGYVNIPSIHSGVLAGLRRFGVDLGGFSILVTGVCYGVIALRVFRDRRKMNVETVLLIGALTTPALTGERPHHYMIAFLPLAVLLGRLLSFDLLPRILRISLLAAFMTGAYYYIGPCRVLADGVGALLGVTGQHMLAFGVFAALMVYWKDLTIPEAAKTQRVMVAAKAA